MVSNDGMEEWVVEDVAAEDFAAEESEVLSVSASSEPASLENGRGTESSAKVRSCAGGGAGAGSGAGGAWTAGTCTVRKEGVKRWR